MNSCEYHQDHCKKTERARQSGSLTFQFYSSVESEPPHVHVLKGGNVAKIWSADFQVEYNRGYNLPELNNIVRLTRANQITEIMFTPGALSFQEFMTHDPLPLATIQDAILEFLSGRSDAVLFGAQAVNVYVAEARMSQDVAIQSTRAPELADEIKTYLADKFHIAIQIHEAAQGRGLRLYQVRKEGNRHLVDIRPVISLPPTRRISQILVASPEELIAQKEVAIHQRSGQPKSFSARRDLAMLLLAFPELKRSEGMVKSRLLAANANPEILQLWAEIVAQEIRATDEDSEFD